MPNTQLQRDLIAHCIEFMSDKDVIVSLLREHGFSVDNSLSYEKLAQAYETMPDALTVDDICATFRNHWAPSDIEGHVAVLQSGLLDRHDWHGAFPSNLHLSLQNRVREYFSETITWEKYMEIGTDILRHECFMLAIHDICETSIIQSFPSVIPPIRSKSLSDFVFDGVPYDLKLTTHKDPWKPFAGHMSLEQKKELAIALNKGADSKRIRPAAAKCRNNWGMSRMFYVVNDQDKWLKDPLGTAQFLLDNLCDTSNYFDIEVNDSHIHICLIEQ